MLDTYQEIKEWFAAKGDDTYIFNHNIDKNSIVVDLGAYTGVWASRLNKYIQCKIYLLEPVEQFYKVLENKFNNNQNINYHQVGIGTEDKILFLSSDKIKQDATRITYSDKNNNSNSTNGSNKIQIITLDNMMNYWDIKHIDLLQINIEGAEYDILENWLKTGIINKIKILQIQFHNFPEIENHVSRRKNIQLGLQKNGYKLKYCFQWVWEAWEKI